MLQYTSTDTGFVDSISKAQETKVKLTNEITPN
jgi:hypothetical protein